MASGQVFVRRHVGDSDTKWKKGPWSDDTTAECLFAVSQTQHIIRLTPSAPRGFYPTVFMVAMMMVAAR